MADTKTLGIQGKTYVGAPGSTPATLLNDETDVNLEISNQMASYATRGQPRKTNRPTTQELKMSFTVVKDFANPQFVALHAAAINRTAVAIKSIDNTSGYGWDGDWYVNAKEGQPLEGWTTVDFECFFTSDNRALSVIDPEEEE